ncbi:cell filamentation protein Fic [Ramlibacter sp. WS9]|nr:cell filamentation protein Fic [Ramlibacter sp. WS9]
MKSARLRMPTDELLFAASLPSAEARNLQRQAAVGALVRVCKGVYAPQMPSEELAALVRRNWQRVAGVVVPGGVVSHISAMKGGVLPTGDVTLSHPTVFNKKVTLPGLVVRVVRGPGPLPGDLPMGTSGVHYAGRTRMLLENIGRKGDLRAPIEDVESRLVSVLNASGEKALNDIRDQAAALSPALGAEKALNELRSIIGALLGTHSKGELRTREGLAVAQGSPVDQVRTARFEVLAAQLRAEPLPRIESNVVGIARQHFAFVESYFSNYVEGTKFDIDQARGIVMNNTIVPNRPKDSHDILGVFRLAITSPFRDSPPVAGPEFLEGLEHWHAEMLKMRPEANPGKPKLEVNYAGTTKFVEPAYVRGTLAEGSRLALSVPEGLARAVYYAFLVSEVHPFDDGNGRLSRLAMNAELTRTGLSRIIIPTLYHPQYVDCARALTRGNDPSGFVRSLAKMARWASQFDYSNLDALITTLRGTNALEESPAQFRLLNADGSYEA